LFTLSYIANKYLNFPISHYINHIKRRQYFKTFGNNKLQWLTIASQSNKVNFIVLTSNRIVYDLKLMTI